MLSDKLIVGYCYIIMLGKWLEVRQGVGSTEFAYGLLVICRLFFSWRYKIHYGRLWLRRIENIAIPRRLGWSWYSQLQIFNSWIVRLPDGRQYNYSSNTTDLEQRFLNFLDCGNLTSFSLGGPSFLSHRFSLEEI